MVLITSDRVDVLIDLLQTDYDGRVDVLVYLTAVRRRIKLLIDLLQSDLTVCRTNSDGDINKSNSWRTWTRLLIDLNVILIARYNTILRTIAGRRLSRLL